MYEVAVDVDGEIVAGKLKHRTLAKAGFHGVEELFHAVLLRRDHHPLANGSARVKMCLLRDME